MACSAEQARINGAKSPGAPAVTIRRRNRVKLRAHEISVSGRSPVDVMFENMCFWHDHVKRLTAKVDAAIVDVEDEDDRREAIALIKELLAARHKSQECAVDLAPYIHPKFATISFVPTKTELKAQDVPADPTDASHAYQRLIAGGA